MKNLFHPKYLLLALLLVVAGTLLGVNFSPEGTDTTEQLKKLEEAFLIINKRYVEEVSAAELAETAIEAMIGTLDPHSSYIDAAAFVKVDEGYRGSFGGVGIWFEIPNGDTAQVVATIEGGPSEKAGLRAGDRIIAVDDSTLVGADEDEVQRRLKGPTGTIVEVLVKRLGIAEPLRFNVVRDTIPLYSVSTAYMVDAVTGYIKISRFAQTTHREFVGHVSQLKDRGLQRLIIDLRDNPGGIMEAAAAVADEMLTEGALIVETRGRAVPDQTLRAARTGMLEDAPVIVLVNRNSISASEILAGALQDHDRALVVGERTWGKALVQNQFRLPDESRLQMTTARYYTPSGRLIQTPYEEGDTRGYLEDKYQSLQEAARDPSQYLDSIPDSLKFLTTHGRTVFGGGGIFPDHWVTTDTLRSPILRLMYQGLLFEPFRTWFNRHEQALRSVWEDREDTFGNAFLFSEAQWHQLWQSAEEAQLAVTITDVSAKVSLADRIVARTDVAENSAVLRGYFKALLARQLYGTRAAYPYYNQIDDLFLEALTLWPLAEALPAQTK